MTMLPEQIRPYEGTDPYIFISYAHRDKDRVLPVLRSLSERGYRIWFDEGIDPGTEWAESIAGHLENSRVCLFFLSPFSAVSQNCRTGSRKNSRRTVICPRESGRRPPCRGKRAGRRP